MSDKPAPERKVVERVVLTEPTNHRGVNGSGVFYPLTDGHWRVVAERLEEEPSEFEKAARECERQSLRFLEEDPQGPEIVKTTRDSQLLEAARLLRRADRESKGGKA
jgi:hypothetical protein